MSEAPLAVVRAVHLGSCVSLAGALCFATFVLRIDPAGSASQRGGSFGRWRRIALWSFAVCLASGGFWLAAESSVMSGVPLREAIHSGLLARVLRETAFGRLWVVRLLAALPVAAVLVRHGKFPEDESALRMQAATFLSFFILASLAWIGHAAAAAGGHRSVHLAVDAIHLIAAGAWLGGLVPLASLLEPPRRDPPDIRLALVGRVTRRFSALARGSVGLLLATGLANAFELLHGFHDLPATPYGRLLLLKTALFVLLLPVAARSRFRLLPSLLAARSDRAAETLHCLRLNLLVETALGVAILGVVGKLGMTPPP